MPVLEETAWGDHGSGFGGERFNRLRCWGKSPARSGESRYPIQPPTTPSPRRDVHELPIEGRSDASPRIALLVSDRCAQHGGLCEKTQRPKSLPAGSSPTAPFRWWELVPLRKIGWASSLARSRPM